VFIIYALHLPRSRKGQLFVLCDIILNLGNALQGANLLHAYYLYLAADIWVPHPCDYYVAGSFNRSHTLTTRFCSPQQIAILSVSG